MPRSAVVFPVPGPPVRTITLWFIAVLIASFCFSLYVIPISFSIFSIETGFIDDTYGLYALSLRSFEEIFFSA